MASQFPAILGINAYHADSSACLFIDGKLVAASEEERFRRIKHWAGIPELAIQHCLSIGGLELGDVEHIAISRNPGVRIRKKALYAARQLVRPSYLLSRISTARRLTDFPTELASRFSLAEKPEGIRFHQIEHHMAHSSSGYYPSPFDEAAVVSVDGMGDFCSTMVSHGSGANIDTISTVEFPHSLGILYTSITQWLGFMNYGDEYKVMGLAAFGEPVLADKIRQLIRPLDNGQFQLSLSHFRHHNSGTNTTWDDTAPTVDVLYSNKLTKVLGQARQSDEEISDYHKDVAASLQFVVEEIYFHILRYAQNVTKLKQVTLAGGVAFNSVANGKILENTDFQEVYFQPAAGDAGTAIGAALSAYSDVVGERPSFKMTHAYWGAEASDTEIQDSLEQSGLQYSKESEESVIARTAAKLADGGIVGWYQGRSEWGPRALGNRSILADPRRADMRETINRKIKFRELFRPFAPAIASDRVSDYFLNATEDPFMIKVFLIRPEKREEIPAVTHVDGTGRIQTVSPETNPLFYNLISKFNELTGTPILLNTSFNENEPIANSPSDAIGVFMRTSLDMLVIGNYMVERS